MEEVFPREVAADPEPFTGERLTSALSGQTQIEHYHRYLFARALCRGLDVLDVASGEGYGSALLAQVARSVIGLEYAMPTVRSARCNFSRPNLIFLQGDARSLPLRAGSVDLVVSFETIEHFDRQEVFVAEVRRVLRPDGCFIVSTPDREIYSAPGVPPNPFHVREMSRPEFAALLRQQFRNAAILSQRPLIGSALLANGALAGRHLVFERDRDAFTACPHLPRAPYLVAVASDRALPTLPSSLYIDRSDLDSETLALAARSDALAAETAALTVRTAELTARTAELAACQAELGACRAKLRTLRTEAAERQAEIARLAHELVIARSSLRAFLGTYLPRLRGHLLRPRRH